MWECNKILAKKFIFIESEKFCIRRREPQTLKHIAVKPYSWNFFPKNEPYRFVNSHFPIQFAYLVAYRVG